MCKVAALHVCLCWQIVKARFVPKRGTDEVLQIANGRRNAPIQREFAVK